ncbi:MAG: hypothetical protein FJX76_22585 [Armatimonadetes bacterium]|nr:hypothetical protein [Armatimonadota bacterium]
MRAWALALAVGVLLPLAGWIADGCQGLLGWSGVGRGEFESWATVEYWLPIHVTRRAAEVGWVWAFLAAPAQMNIGNGLDAWLTSIPAKALFGVVAGHNLRVVLVLLANAVGGMVLGRVLAPGAQWTAAALALALALNPLTLWDVAESRFAQALVAPMFVYLAALLVLAREPSRRHAVRAGIALGVTGVFYWYWGMFVGLLGMLTVVATRDRRLHLTHLVLGGVVALPFAAPFAFNQVVDKPYGTRFPPLAEIRVPIEGMLGPPGPGLMVSQSVDLAEPLTQRGGPAVWWPWVGLAVAGLAVTLRKRGGALEPVVAVHALCLWVLALGPYLVWQGAPRDVALPFQAWYQYVPAMSRFNWPGRMLVPVFIDLVVLAGPLLVSARGAAAAVVALALWSQGMTGLSLTHVPVRVPAFYRNPPGDGGIIEASLPWNSSVAGWHQSWHGRKSLGTMEDTLLGNRVRYAIECIRNRQPHVRFGRHDVAELQAAGYRWLVVLNIDPNVDALRKTFTEGLRAAPAFRDNEVTAWDLTRVESKTP